MTAPAAPAILFGAFDRHNFGDLLFPHVAAALLPGRELIFAGLAERDLTPFGGHRVQSVVHLAAEWESRYGDAPAHVIHVGGELLTCDAYEAAIMVLAPEEAQAAIAEHEADPHRLRWAQSVLGIAHGAAYVVPKSLFRHPGHFIFNGVGGVGLARRDPAVRQEVLDNLRAASWVAVRDGLTLATLAGAGLAARLMPDPAVLVAELFGEHIREHMEAGEPAAVRAAFPQGYVAVQFAAALGDDASLAGIVDGVGRLARARGLGVVFFRAGGAPWHDDVGVYGHAAAQLPGARVFGSLDLWDICALIAGSAAYCGGSLHGRLVAEAFGVPVEEGIVPVGAKVRSYRDTWRGHGAAPAARAAMAEWAVLLN